MITLRNPWSRVHSEGHATPGEFFARYAEADGHAEALIEFARKHPVAIGDGDRLTIEEGL